MLQQPNSIWIMTGHVSSYAFTNTNPQSFQTALHIWIWTENPHRYFINFEAGDSTSVSVAKAQVAAETLWRLPSSLLAHTKPNCKHIGKPLLRKFTTGMNVKTREGKYLKEEVRWNRTQRMDRFKRGLFLAGAAEMILRSGVQRFISTMRSWMMKEFRLLKWYDFEWQGFKKMLAAKKVWHEETTFKSDAGIWMY